MRPAQVSAAGLGVRYNAIRRRSPAIALNFRAGAQERKTILVLQIRTLAKKELRRRQGQSSCRTGMTLIAQTGWDETKIARNRVTWTSIQHHLTKPVDHHLLEKILREILD